MTIDTDGLMKLLEGALALVRLGPLTKHEHQELDSLMTRAVNALPELLAERERLREALEDIMRMDLIAERTSADEFYNDAITECRNLARAALSGETP